MEIFERDGNLYLRVSVDGGPAGVSAAAGLSTIQHPKHISVVSVLPA